MSNGRRVTVRLGDAEAEVVRGTASALGVTESEVMRLALTALAGRLPDDVTERATAAPVSREVVEMRDALDRALAAICRIGVNINQIVRMAHVMGWSDDVVPGLREIPDAVDGLAKYVGKAVDDVGK
ncbi:MobC family plasmid mobilization relaxosome protein [Corynebacterium macginleyi]|uniref:MobC family plasmid mobilization relaxosome protein n=1 Tax=Corynebacterium macginleyi TaxID=38290 RepID=UPI0011C3D36C|nr:MobC family plasmid mobilization relaxosome protein [Corynebacterium macginleyi]QRP21834.1 hypothetical protein I6J25_03135 [Corynebacterium macginleyi]